MPDPITVSALTATPGIGHIALQWTLVDPNRNGLPSLSLDAVEVRASLTNDRSVATKIAEGRTTALHMALVEGVTYYYWIKPRNLSGLYGDWYPSGATSGLQATVGFAAGASQGLINGRLDVSVGADACTAAVKALSGDNPSATNPVYCGFRSQDGTYTVIAITAALSLAIPSGAEVGVVNSVAFRIWWLLINDGGTVRLACIKCTEAATSTTPDGKQISFIVIHSLSEVGFCSASAIGTGSDSAGIFYAGSAVTNKAFRIIGFSDWNGGLASKGAWATAPSLTFLFAPGTKTPGEEVQSSRATIVGTASGSAALPFDSTIPQSNEGNEFFLKSYTAKSPANIIENSVSMACVSNGAGTVATAALFKDTDASAIAAEAAAVDAAQSPSKVSILHRAVANTASAVAYKVRAGTAAGNMKLNGATGVTLGDLMASHHTIRELMG